MDIPRFLKLTANKNHIIFDLDETIVTLNIDWSEWYEQCDVVIQKYEPDFKKTRCQT